MRNTLKWAALPLAVLTLAACGERKGEVEADGTMQPSSQTLAEAVKGDGAFDTLEKVVGNAGLGAVLESRGPYTVFAPADGAFESAGDDFASDTMRAQAVALLRSHHLPGALPRHDLAAAGAAASRGKVGGAHRGQGGGFELRPGDGRVVRFGRRPFRPGPWPWVLLGVGAAATAVLVVGVLATTPYNASFDRPVRVRFEAP